MDDIQEYSGVVSLSQFFSERLSGPGRDYRHRWTDSMFRVEQVAVLEASHRDFLAGSVLTIVSHLCISRK